MWTRERVTWNEVEAEAGAQILRGPVDPGKEFRFYSIMFIEKPGFSFVFLKIYSGLCGDIIRRQIRRLERQNSGERWWWLRGRRGWAAGDGQKEHYKLEIPRGISTRKLPDFHLEFDNITIKYMNGNASIWIQVKELMRSVFCRSLYQL